MNDTRNSTRKFEDIYPLSQISRYFTYGVMICMTSILSIAILSKCRKIVPQIRITSIQLCVANVCFGLALTANAAYGFNNGTPCAFLFKMLHSCCLTYFLFMSFTGVDRLLSLTLTTRYNFWMRKRNIYIVTGSIYAVAFGFCIILNFQPHSMFQCRVQKGDAFIHVGIGFFLAIMLILMAVHGVCFLYIGCIVEKKSSSGPSSKKNAYVRYWNITLKMLRLGIMSFVLVTPYIIVRLQHVIQGNLAKREGTFADVASLELLHIHQILSPVFILFSYHECRYVILNAILCCCEKRRENVHNQYVQYYAPYKISCIPRVVSPNNDDCGTLTSTV